jgi:HK97 family phage portal protein
MGFGDKILSYFGYHKGIRTSFMTFTGNADTPGFTLRYARAVGIREAYDKCAPVSTIINRLASSMANGKWFIVDKNNNDVSNSHANVYNLIKNPNPLQSTSEFIKQVDLYRNLYGVSYVYAAVPNGFGSAEDALSVWPINPEKVETIYKKSFPYFGKTREDIIEKYVITSGNERLDVNPEHMLHLNETSLDLLNENRFDTRLRGLNYEIRNIMQAQEAIYSLNRDRGAQGIISNRTRDVSGNIPLTPVEKEQIQEEYQKKYGLSNEQAKIIISDADLVWQQMSFNVKDLMLFEGIKQNIESISDAFNYPFELLANQKGTTFANRGEAVKYLYQDNIIPAANLYAEKFTAFFGLQNATIDIDFSHIEYLKQAEKEKAEALLKMNQALQIPYRLNVITREEYRKLLDLDEQPEGTTYFNENETGNETTAGQPQGNGQGKAGERKSSQR